MRKTCNCTDCKARRDRRFTAIMIYNGFSPFDFDMPSTRVQAEILAQRLAYRQRKEGDA